MAEKTQQTPAHPYTGAGRPIQRRDIELWLQTVVFSEILNVYDMAANSGRFRPHEIIGSYTLARAALAVVADRFSPSDAQYKKRIIQEIKQQKEQRDGSQNHT